MAVFAFPANDSFVSAKSCKDQKSDLRGDKKENIKNKCGNILEALQRRC